MEVEFEIGTMIEIPRAALTADRIATEAQYFSFWMPREEQRLYAECLGYVSKRNIPANSSLTIRLRSATVIREVKVIPKSDSLKHYHFLKQ